MMARSSAQQTGNLFLRIPRRDQDNARRDLKDIVRIVGWLRVQRGLHRRSRTSKSNGARPVSTLQSGLTKARQQDGEYGALMGADRRQAWGTHVSCLPN
jgi:hypothetical protein